MNWKNFKKNVEKNCTKLTFNLLMYQSLSIFHFSIKWFYHLILLLLLLCKKMYLEDSSSLKCCGRVVKNRVAGLCFFSLELESFDEGFLWDEGSFLLVLCDFFGSEFSFNMQVEFPTQGRVFGKVLHLADLSLEYGIWMLLGLWKGPPCMMRVALRAFEIPLRVDYVFL